MDCEKLVLSNQVARTAYKENKLRRVLAKEFDAARKKRGLSVRKFADLIGVSVVQARRLLHLEVGGSIALMTYVRASNALGLELVMSV